MKFLIIGLGSMGKRRIRNLKHLGAGDIIGFDISAEKRKEAREKYGIETFRNIKDALREKPDAMIISTTPELHYRYAMLAAEKRMPFFTELNLISEGLDKVVKLANKNKIVAAASCDMRYMESIKKIKDLLDKKSIGKVTAFTYHVGQYLPDWHPWEDYRKSFFSKKETGGCRELIAEELNWLTCVFGNITEVSCMKGKFSNLDVDIPDTYQMLFNFENKFLGNLLVDVVSRVPYHQLKIVGEKGIILWNESEKKVSVFNAKEKGWKHFYEKKGTVEKGYVYAEEPYIEEIKHFIRAIECKEKYPYALAENLENLKILDAIENSAKKKRHVKVI